MSENISVKGKHLNIVDRTFIEDALKERYTLKQIAQLLQKDTTTISKEIKKNRMHYGRRPGKDFIVCEKRKGCSKISICKETCNQLCYKCKTKNCYRICPDYKPKTCARLKRYPYVCNGCERNLNCSLRRYHYRAKVAEANYRDILSTARQGIDMSKQELDKLDALVAPLILKGQPLCHIHHNHKDEIGCSIRTLYNYVDQRVLSVRNIDLPRKVKYKPRAKTKKPVLKDQRYKEGRRYVDFLAYIDANPEIPVVEMDTVYGRRERGKTLLTMYFRNCSIMLAFIMEACTQDCVINVIDQLYETLGAEVFGEHFPVLLTDNGSEFKAPGDLEFDKYGSPRTKVFYCDPLAPYQKARLEKNHEYIRYILPKGKSFDSLTQENVTLMINHINSTARASKNGSPPFLLAQMLLNNVLLEKLSLQLIPADEVLLKPALLKK